MMNFDSEQNNATNRVVRHPTWAWWLERLSPTGIYDFPAGPNQKVTESAEAFQCGRRPAMNAAIRVSNTLLRSSQSLPRQASASKLPSLQSSKAWICDQCYKRAISSKKSSACASYPAIRSSRNDPRRDQIPSIGRPRSRTFSTRDDDGPASARKELPSHKESRQSPFYNRFSSMMDHAQSNIFIAGQRLNDLTGYSGIEALKKDIEEQGTKIYLLLAFECTHKYQSSPSSQPALRSKQLGPHTQTQYPIDPLHNEKSIHSCSENTNGLLSIWSDSPRYTVRIMQTNKMKPRQETR